MEQHDPQHDKLDWRTREFLYDIQSGYGDVRPELDTAAELANLSQNAGEVALDGAEVVSGRIDDGYGDRDILPFHFHIARLNENGTSNKSEACDE